MEYKELLLEDISEDMLDHYERYEEVNKAWRTENGIETLKDIHYIEHWDKNRLTEVCQEMKETIINNGTVFVAIDNNMIVGFAALENKPFGSREQYLQLSMLHVTKSYRHNGLGRELFKKCAQKTKDLGVEKMYISTSSSENAQAFYRGIGCVKAIEVNERLTELEPCDVQMEYAVR